MDFTLLPDNVFLQILRYLPFKDRVQSGEVNSSFRRISKISISETKVLVFRLPLDPFDYRLTPPVLSALVELCAKNLEEVRFDYLHWQRSFEKPLLEAFARFHCPNLKIFQCSVADREVLNGVLVNNPNLKELIVKEYMGDFPDITTCEKLETLRCCCSDSTLRSLTGRIPNLKVLVVVDSWITSPASLHGFLNTVPNLETLRITWHGEEGSYLDLDREPANTCSFWRLGRLTTLEIVDYNEYGRWTVGDDSMMKVAKSFPQLRRLQLPAGTMANIGLAALSSLQELQELSLDYGLVRPLQRDISAECVAALVVCSHLRKLRFLGMTSLSPSVVLTVLRSCPQLCEVHFWDFLSVHSRDEAEAVVRSLAGLGKREIRLTFYKDSDDTRSIWRSRLVKAALKKLNEEEGLVVELDWPNIPNVARIPAVEDHWDPAKDAAGDYW